MHVLDNPWAVFRFDNEQHRTWLAHNITALELDVLFVGPLTRVGMNEAGTLQETRDFSQLLESVRNLAGRPITFVLVHHQNKGGQVSGAWEGAGDTLLHVTAQGHGKTRVHVQKARWASSWHGKSIQLVWADGEGFLVADAPQRDTNTIADEILAAVLAEGGRGWNQVAKSVSGNAVKTRAVRDQLLEAGQLVDANAAQGRRTMVLWHPNDPLCPVRLDTDTPLDTPEGDGPESVTVSLCPPLKGHRTLDADAPSPDRAELDHLNATTSDTPEADFA